MHRLAEFMGNYGLLAVFINVLVEGLGLPVPSYPILIVAAAMPHHFQPIDVALTGIIASMTADSVWFWSGRRFGGKIVGFLCKISLAPDTCVRQTSALTARFGLAALSFTKFFPGLGTMAIVLAGTAKTRIRAFLFFDLIGATIYIGVAVLLGVVFHDAVDDTLDVFARLGKWGLVALGGLLGLYLFAKWWHRRQLINQLRMDRITVDELSALIDSGQKPVIIDAQTPEGRAWHGVIPGAIPVDIHDLESITRLLTPSSEVIVYCACPNEASAALVATQLKKAGFKKIRPLLGGIDAWRKAGYAKLPYIQQAAA